jgi:hypothetical protein
MKPLAICLPILVVGLTATLLACGDATEPGPTRCTKNSTVYVKVGAGPSPEISWLPKLLVASVNVRDNADNRRLVWFATSEGNSLTSPVQVSVVLEPSAYEVDVVCVYSDGLTSFAKIIGTTYIAR